MNETMEVHEPREDYRVFQVGGWWGNNINIQNRVEEVGGLAGLRVVGWVPVLPKPRDVLVCDMQSGREAAFLFTEIEYCHDPPDMFFATVSVMGYVDELPYDLNKAD